MNGQTENVNTPAMGVFFYKGGIMPYYKTLCGKKCYLSPMSIESVDRYTEWFNDIEMSKNLVTISQMITREGEQAFIDATIKNGKYIFDIIDLENDIHIGNVGIFDIDHINRTAELGIAIGDKLFWGKGYGTEALQLILDFCFNILNLYNVMLKYYEYNERGGRCYTKVGFKEIGRRRKAKIIAGKHFDIVHMDILAEEFTSPFVKKFFT